jgi:large conductance mechanosensitive channel
MKLIKEFKEFAVKGNMVDIAIGVIIGASFNKVVDVLVKKIFMPPLSFLTEGVNVGNKKWVLREAVMENGEAKVEEIAIGFGALVEATVDFLIIALTVFLVVKFINVIREKAEDPEDASLKTPKNIELLNKVADLLEKQNQILKDKS